MPFLDHRFKLPIHIIELVLIVVVIGLSAPRLFMKDQPRSRANTIALGMGAKSIVIIGYQLLSEHVKRFNKWASKKANMILNGLEIVFWAAVIFLVMQGNIQACVAVGCILGWVVVGVAIVITSLTTWAFAISLKDWLAARRVGSATQQSVRRGHERSNMEKVASDSPV